MAPIGLFYDSETGNTEALVGVISEKFGDGEIESKSVWDESPESFKNYKAMIFATPTVGEGDLPEGWQRLLDQMSEGDLSDLTVGLIALGDQYTYGDEFVNALGDLYDTVKKLGANVVGFWSTDGYDFEETTSIRDGKFPGLVLDEDNQSEETDGRLDTWLGEVKPLLQAAIDG